MQLERLWGSKSENNNKNNGKKEQADLRKTTQLHEWKPAIMCPSVSVIARAKCGEGVHSSSLVVGI